MESLSCLSALKSTQGVLKDANFIAQKKNTTTTTETEKNSTA